MSDPISKAELHEAVDEYVSCYCGEYGGGYYIHEQIDHPEKRDLLFDEFMEFINN